MDASGKPRGFRWWYLPSWLGLDAPFVVSTWTIAIGLSVGREISWWALTALFFAVWSIYLMDRLVDVARCRDWSVVTGRMHFGNRHRSWFLGGLAISIGVNAVLLGCGVIPQAVITRALLVAVGMAVYTVFFVVPLVFRRRLPGKEMGVGLFFAAGAFAVLGGGPATMAQYVALALVACFNCLLIAARERESDAVVDRSSAAQWWRSIDRDLSWLGMAQSALALLLALATAACGFYLSVSAAFAGLVVLHKLAGRVSADGVRAVADFCLLTPWLWFALLAFSA